MGEWLTVEARQGSTLLQQLLATATQVVKLTLLSLQLELGRLKHSIYAFSRHSIYAFSSFSLIQTSTV